MASTTTYAHRLNDDASLEAMLRDHRRIGVEGCKDAWEKATKYQKFARREQWPDADKARGDSPNTKSPRLVIDEIGPVLQIFSGREMMQRFERAYIPRHPGAARQGEVMTAVDRAMMQAANAEQVLSAVFKDGPGIQGIAANRWELDDLGELGAPGGLLINDLPIWQVMWDPEARKINLSDRAWHRYGSWWAQQDVREKWSEKFAEILGQIGSTSWAPSDTGESSRIPWQGMAGNKPLQPYYPKGRMLWVEYEEWKEVVSVYDVGRPVDPEQSYADAFAASVAREEGQPDVFTSEEMTKKQLQEFREQRQAVFGEDVPRELTPPRRKLVYKYAYICGETILETGEVPIGYWTIQFLTGFREPQPTKTTWGSLVARLVDPQKWINVMLSALIRNIQITPKGLLFAEEGFFKNRNEAMAAWAAPSGLVMVGRGKLSGSAPGYKWESGGTSPYASMLESLMSFYREAIPRLAGFNPGALGQVGGDLRRISGEVVRQLQDTAMVANAEPFDSKRHHSREGGRIFLAFMRRFFEIEDLIRVVGEEVAYEPVIDPMTQQPVPDPLTGEPMRRLAIPPKEAWAPDWWKEIAVEDVVPTGDQLQALWKALETSIQILLTPQPDTRQPLFSSEDLAEIIPGIPAQRREKMLQRIRAAIVALQSAPPPPANEELPAQEAA